MRRQQCMILPALLLAVLVLSSCAAEDHYPLGTAGSINGKTVILSIFADDTESAWDFEKEEDLDRYWDCRYRLADAVYYLQTRVEEYGGNAEFIYDWQEDPSLAWTVHFDEKLVSPDGEKGGLQAEWLKNFFDPDEQRKKYGADNVIYIFYFNTPPENTVKPWAISRHNSTESPMEMINIYVGYDGEYAEPAVYAHEILHLFGAPDFYMAGELIPEAYVQHLEATGSNDIMFKVSKGRKILNSFTETDAYYLGLLDTCPDAEKWGLGKSEHLK